VLSLASLLSRATAFHEHFFAYAQRHSAGTSFGFAENRSSLAACAAKPYSLHCLRFRRKPPARATAFRVRFFASGETANPPSPALNTMV
jgi:hypothetical protein